jgi:lysine/ornithine N-monooxygenase
MTSWFFVLGYALSAFLTTVLKSEQGCCRAHIPNELTKTLPLYKGLVIHTSQFEEKREQLLKLGNDIEDDESIVIVGCGKSAQEYDFRTFTTSQVY